MREKHCQLEEFIKSSVTKVEFQVLCLQVGGSCKIVEVQVRVLLLAEAV